MPADGPTVWTIDHVLDVLRDSLLPFDLPGKRIRTSTHPGGICVAARSYMTIADLQASKKITGFGSPTSSFFCTYCLCPFQDLQEFDYASWVPRTGETVRQQAIAWKETETVQGKKDLFATNSVRWTPMHDLPNWNPVLHTILGFMHNVLEGILEDHLRNIWGLGRKKEVVKLIAEKQADEKFSDADTAEAWSELESLSSDVDVEMEEGSSDQDGDEDSGGNGDSDETEAEGEEEETNDVAEVFPQTIPFSGGFYREVLQDSSVPGLDRTYSEMLEEPNNGYEEDPDFFEMPEGAFNFTKQQVEAIRECIGDVMLPSWVERPPRNLGEAKHGKLKAHELLVLFTVIFPLIIPELWFNGNEAETRRLENFCDLVAAVNLIASYSTSNADADMFRKHYRSYIASRRHVYPDFHFLPNHHYAEHYPEQLKFWGPLSTLSEFPGERLNGELANIPTNNHFGKPHLQTLRLFAKIICSGYGIHHDAPVFSAIQTHCNAPRKRFRRVW
jgi:hypothetical protein